MREISRMTIHQLRSAIARRELSIGEVVRGYLDRIEATEPHVRSFLHLDADQVLAQVKEIESRDDVAALPLAGIPIAVKDILTTRSMPTTCGSRILEEYRPPYDSTVVARLRAAGAVILGKTNCDEFAMGSSTENSAYQATRNPWDLERVPGGSSGGSAAAVASGQSPASIGTDTGGSIRQPAAFCGTVGLKPTYGRVSRYGLVAFASSLDQAGPLTRTVRDAALMLRVLAGADPRDSTCSTRDVEDFSNQLDTDLKGLRIGVVADWMSSGLDPDVKSGVEKSVELLQTLGVSVREVELPHSQYAIAAYYIIAPAEASSNLARYDGVRYGYRAPDPEGLSEMYRSTRSRGFGAEVKRRVMLGTYVLSAGYYDAYFLKASKIRRLIYQDFQNAFQQVDLLVGPVTPTPPFRLGEKSADPLQMYLQDIFTVTANLSGVPGLSLPCGFTPSGLPLGVQLLAPHFQETQLLQAGHALEQALALQPPALPI